VARTDAAALDPERHVGLEPDADIAAGGIGGSEPIVGQPPLGGDAAVVEHRLAHELDLDRTVHALHDPDERMVGVLVGRRAGVGRDRVDPPAGTHGQRIAHDDPPARGVPRGHEHVRPGLVVPGARNREPVRAYAEAPRLPVEQAAEHARRVEARHAQPVDRAVGRHERAGVAVRQEGVVRDRRKR
jgi:hypothetical protein